MKLERSVTKPYWTELKEILKGQIDIEQVPAPRDGVRRVWCNKDRCAYVITEKVNDDIQPIAWLYLWQRPRWQAWEVLQVFVPEALRGKGLSTRLYRAAVNDGLILASGKSQTKSSRALWRSFIKKKIFNVYAIDFKNLDLTSEVLIDKDDNELWCALDIYSDNKHQDVRFVAIRK